MNILVTNDDGVHAPGIKALAEKLREVGEVTVVAPLREMSAVSHALTISAPLRFEHHEDRTFFVEGTPADCVNLAVGKLLPNPPDIVVSGINRGANVGDDIAYSGTVAGAREAAMLGVPSIAISLASKDEDADYRAAASFASEIVRTLVEKKEWSRRTFLNVNVPRGKVHGVRVTSQGRRDYWAKVEERVDPRSRVYYWIQTRLQPLGKKWDVGHPRTPKPLHLCHAPPIRLHEIRSTRRARVMGPPLQRLQITPLVAIQFFFCARLELGSHVPLE